MLAKVKVRQRVYQVSFLDATGIRRHRNVSGPSREYVERWAETKHPDWDILRIHPLPTRVEVEVALAYNH